MEAVRQAGWNRIELSAPEEIQIDGGPYTDSLKYPLPLDRNRHDEVPAGVGGAKRTLHIASKECLFPPGFRSLNQPVQPTE